MNGGLITGILILIFHMVMKNKQKEIMQVKQAQDTSENNYFMPVMVDIYIKGKVGHSIK